MDTTFKATHVIVATSYEDAEKYGLTVGTEVMNECVEGECWQNSDGYIVHRYEATVEPIKPPATLFTEAQLGELEGLYGLKRVTSDTCTKPPTGWCCSRAKGHEGPCAAESV